MRMIIVLVVASVLAGVVSTLLLPWRAAEKLARRRRLASGRVAATNAPPSVSEEELARQLRGMEAQVFGRGDRAHSIAASKIERS